MLSLPNFTVRKARMADASFILSIVNNMVLMAFELAEFELILKNKINSKDQFIFILETTTNKKNEQAGLLVLSQRHSLIEKFSFFVIEEMYIAPKYRKLNAADYLFNFVDHFAKVQKAGRLKVACNINSTLNQRFYTSRGFKFLKKQYFKDI